MSTTAALMPGHMFTSYSGADSQGASCECGHDLNWDTRDKDHALHLLAVAWNRGYNSNKVTSNPFIKEH